MARHIQQVAIFKYGNDQIIILEEKTNECTWYFIQRFEDSILMAERSYKTLHFALECLNAWIKYLAVKQAALILTQDNHIPTRF